MIIGYSGGRDSTTLLHLLSKEYEVYPVYCDHGWELDKKPPLDCEVIKSSSEVSSESKARNWRYEVLTSIAKERNADLAIGHTASDRVETLIYNLCRGSSLKGLSTPKSISYRNGVKIIRPLLNWSREETKQYCLDNNLPFIDDPYNESLRFKRVRIRKEVLPLLDELHPGVLNRLTLTSSELEEDNEFLELTVQQEYPKRVEGSTLNVKGLHISIKRRLIKKFLRDVCKSTPSRDTINRVLSLPKTQVKGGLNVYNTDCLITLTN